MLVVSSITSWHDNCLDEHIEERVTPIHSEQRRLLTKSDETLFNELCISYLSLEVRTDGKQFIGVDATHPELIKRNIRTLDVQVDHAHREVDESHEVKGKLRHRREDLSAQKYQNGVSEHEMGDSRPPWRPLALVWPVHSYPTALLRDENEAPPVRVPIAPELRVDGAERIYAGIWVMQVQLRRRDGRP